MERFDIAFSYASEQSEIIEQFKMRLKELGLSVFIDTEHPELFVFKHVPDVLKGIYDYDEIVMLIFLSKDYAKKDFTKYEGHIASERLIKEKRTAIIKIDDATLPWLPSSLHFFDIRKNSIDYICKALYVAIKGESLCDTKTLFKNIKDYLILKCGQLKTNLNSETCVIFNIIKSKEKYIKMYYNKETKRILFFYISSYIEEKYFSIAEIYKFENKYIFYNKGISDTQNVISEFVNENELNINILSNLNIFLSNIYD